MNVNDIRLGSLRDRIDIVEPTTGTHPRTGEALASRWKTIDRDIPAKITTQQTEGEINKRQTAITRYSVVIRFRDDMAGMSRRRIVIDGAQCEIQSAVDPTRRRRWLVMTVIELAL